MRLLTGDKNLACRPIPKPDAINLLILDNTKGRNLLKLQEDHNTLWHKYDLQNAVDTCGVTSIEQIVDAQYIEERLKEYAVYNNGTIHSLLAHVQTWSIINNREKIEAKARFHTPWINYPDQHITAFAHQLDTRQRDCAKLKSSISKTDKGEFFVKNRYDCGLFEAKFFEERETLTDQTWAPTRAIFTKKYSIVMRATNCKDYKSGYESTDTLRECPSAKTSTATPKCYGMLVYAAALEEQVTALQKATDDDSLAADHTVVSNFSVSAATVHSKNSTLIDELQANRKDHTSQTKRLAALVNSLASKNDGPPADPTRDWFHSGNRNNRKNLLAQIAIKLGSPTPTTSAWNWRRTPTKGFPG